MAESNDTNNEASTPKVPRMMESMGWLTESLLVPRKGKKIEGVGAGTLVDLKAQYYISQEEAREQKDGGVSFKGRKRKNTEDVLFSKTNKGVMERDKKDKLQLKSKEAIEEESLAQLEKKAELYDQLAQKELNEDDKDLYEVDFFEKRYEHEVKKQKDSETERNTDPVEDEARKQRRELVLEQAGLTKKGREKAAQIKEARMLQQKQNRERLKMSFLRRKLEEVRSQKQSATENPQRESNPE